MAPDESSALRLIGAHPFVLFFAPILSFAFSAGEKRRNPSGEAPAAHVREVVSTLYGHTLSLSHSVFVRGGMCDAGNAHARYVLAGRYHLAVTGNAPQCTRCMC